jgi:hypothetical protein
VPFFKINELGRLPFKAVTKLSQSRSGQYHDSDNSAILTISLIPTPQYRDMGIYRDFILAV